ncbi:uncharacterized protein L203_103303 [Cryptococcus depauperatus CBS 7841]|uniref:Uncharacterized protein n=1 Tax=Cryptococcus depauperatus CBS 7841 TaxID=1295531 RepID=A0A1E3I1Z1_9TREE|nr:hypothetical protein L203_05336 [Cryptococcus depauperatus CBS 7841]
MANPASSKEQQGGPHLKQLFKAADILLKPPKALPANPLELLPRLKSCSKSLPKEWRKLSPEWSDEDEMEYVGDCEGQVTDEERRKKRRDELVFVVGKRCFAMIKAMQASLEKEFWPQEQRDGLEDKDFLLGTADHRLLRLMLSHTTFSYLLPLTVRYAESLPEPRQEIADTLSQALDAILKLLKTSTSPAPEAGPSSRVPTAPTAITQNLLSSHLLPVFLSTLVLAYTPSVAPETYASLRMALMQALLSLAPGHAISSLVNVLKLLVQGRKKGAKANGWVRGWPKYPETIINGLLTAQVRRPGGVKGLMENVLGDTARTDEVASIVGKRLDHIFNVLVRIPRQVTLEIYYPWLLSELFSMIPLDDTSSHHPIAYVNTACYCIQRLWRSNDFIKDWLKNKLHSPWHPKLPLTIPSNQIIEVTSWQAIWRSIQNIRLLLVHNPATPDFVDFLVGCILPPLFSLYSFLSLDVRAPKAISIAMSSENGARKRLIDDLSFLLNSWGKIVDNEMGAKRLWDLIETRNGWKIDMNDEMLDLFWREEDEGVSLMYGMQWDTDSTSDIHFFPPDIEPLGLDSDDIAEQIRVRTKSMPSPTLLCNFIKNINRPRIACQVILKALHLWRIKSSIWNKPSIDAMLHLQLTMKLMTHLGSELFVEPEQLLDWIEQTLADQANMLENEEYDQTSKLQKPLIVEVETKRANAMDISPNGNRGLVELACQLLTSTEVKNALNEKGLSIIHPIIAHLDSISELSLSSSVKTVTRETSLLLLSLQADPISDVVTVTKKTPQEKFTQAMKLVKDMAVPVRAHGLNMLRDIVFGSPYDSSLTPSILDAYIDAIEDDDSFIYLCAIKGLSSMVDALGNEVFDKLMECYVESTKTLKRSTRSDMIDRSLRLAEAVDQVVVRMGDNLGSYADKIIPVLLSIFPDRSLATAIRSSALSILTSCAKTSYSSLLPWLTDLTTSIIHLIQLESVPVSPFKPTTPYAPEKAPEPVWSKKMKSVQLVEDDLSQSEEVEEQYPPNPWIEDTDPLAFNDSKHPVLRRAAIVFLNWVFSSMTFEIMSDYPKSTIKRKDEIFFKEPLVSDRLQGETIVPELLERAETVLAYVKATDVDEVVRGHAASTEKMLMMLKSAIAIQNGRQTPTGGLEYLKERLEQLRMKR